MKHNGNCYIFGHCLQYIAVLFKKFNIFDVLLSSPKPVKQKMSKMLEENVEMDRCDAIYITILGGAC